MKSITEQFLIEFRDYRKSTEGSLKSLLESTIKSQKDIEYTQRDVNQIKESLKLYKKEIEKEIIKIVKQKSLSLKLWITATFASGMTTLALFLINKYI
jgi:sugar-specific transcriptional regulator TrmB